MALSYNLGEMKSETGEALRFEVEALASELAINISEIVQACPIYRNIADKLTSPKTLLYFQKVIKSEIYSVVLQYCVLRWYKRNNVKIDAEDRIILVPSFGIYPLLGKVWPDKTIPLKLAKRDLNKYSLSYCYQHFVSFVKDTIRNLWYWVDAVYCKWKYADAFSDISTEHCNIALEYNEGLDIQRRSDLVWFPQSRINPQRVLIYFDSLDHHTGKPIDDDVLKSVEQMGIKWIRLKRGILRGILNRKNVPVWYPPRGSMGQIRAPDLKPRDPVEKWISKTGRKLLKKVNYWSAFYEAFNIPIHFIIGEGNPEYIAQSIASDINTPKRGILVRKQRSEIYWPSELYPGHYPADVFFTWAPHVEKYLRPNLNMISLIAATGYPNDLVFRSKSGDADKLASTLRSRGADYIVALFDNVHGQHLHFSTETMEKFYLAFLTWLLEDNTLGIVIKSKKPSVLEGLPQIMPVLARAEATGRCVRLRNGFGRLPVDASFVSDMSVGIGISSAVTESVIAGCRGLHCDLTFLKSHEYYQWGYERIIFDDLDRLISAMKGHKADRKTCPDLGDWTPFLDRLDPFRDGRAGERIGTYLRWCLDGFDSGWDREKVLSEVNKRYSSQWGSDKVVALEINEKDSHPRSYKVESVEFDRCFHSHSSVDENSLQSWALQKPPLKNYRLPKTLKPAKATVTDKLISERYQFRESFEPSMSMQSQKNAREAFLNDVHWEDSYISIAECPYCSGTDFTKISEVANWGLPAEIVICNLCDGCFKGKVLNARFTRYYYEKISYALRGKEVSGEGKEALFKQRVKSRAYARFHFVSHFIQLSREEDLMAEFGCGDGANLLPWLEAGFRVLGVELDPKLVEFGRRKGLNLIHNDFMSDDISAVRPKVIILSHVLEHVTNISAVLNRLWTMVQPDGYLFIEVPGVLHQGLTNPLSYFDVEHNYYFDATSLGKLLTKHGFRAIYMDEYIRVLCTPGQNQSNAIEFNSTRRPIPLSASRLGADFCRLLINLMRLNGNKKYDLFEQSETNNFKIRALTKLQSMYFRCYYSAIGGFDGSAGED